MAGSDVPQVDSESLGFLEELFLEYTQDPERVAPEWRAFFASWPGGEANGHANGNGNGTYRIAPSFTPPPLFGAANGAGTSNRLPAGGDATSPARVNAGEVLQERVDLLIRNYRVRGHIIAKLDPLGQIRPTPVELDQAFYRFTEADLDRTFSTTWLGGADVRTLREIIQWLENTYCRSIGVQYMHIDSLHLREWLQARMESTQNRTELSRAEQLRILKRLTDAVVFEEFLQKKYTGAKSFSLEGAESLIPLLDLAIEKAGNEGVHEIVLGMAHRGRLNVLTNIMGKPPRQVFHEFDDKQQHLYRGDVKYHLGYSGDWITSTGNKVHLSLCFNPSHLEYVNTVALGRMRAKQDRFDDTDRRHGLVILVHGDAAFAGEGIVQETLNLGQLAGYATGGTIHVVVNNQLGFTTDPLDARSCTYATDVAKMLQTPIFHVNGEDPEAVAQVVRLALDFRTMFQRDVVIDMYCYRQRGHNEGDEPSFTQPLMYKTIESRKSIRDSYLDTLLELGGISSAEAFRIAETSRDALEKELAAARSPGFTPIEVMPRFWDGYFGGPAIDADEPDTGVPQAELSKLLHQQTTVPADFHPHPKLVRMLSARREMAEGTRPLDWATGEALAFAALLAQGIRIRMTGQDCQRGTFSSRHAVLHDVENGSTYMPLANLSADQGPIEIYNSPLSEAGVLGFEYGYSLDYPDGLVMWEAQFGDFVNCAQPIIDQFLCSAEDKWKRLSGVVLLLPHGFEGQGPEHSSARLERFLSSAAEDNIQVLNLSTPAQYFHLLRRQALRKWKKPLILMTPKSLLRHPGAVSDLEECATGKFHQVMADTTVKPRSVKQIVLCSGKVYYDLVAYREEQKRNDVALVRVEQLYPIPTTELEAALAGYAASVPVLWVQEEPENMGAWRFLRSHWGDKVEGRSLLCVSRPESASPATGSNSSHKIEQRHILEAAFSR